MSADARFERYVERLSDEDALVLHRIVCRRAAHIYEPRYRTIRDHNWKQAMANRNTRFQKGLSVLENITRTQRA